MKDAEKSIVGNGDSYAFKSKLENLPDSVVVIGSHTQNDSRKEKWRGAADPEKATAGRLGRPLLWSFKMHIS
ncbi:unnamed protein product [Sphenostylis stenocarpa]|uniref:Uncharacterized protein n=1 Tax=Sphenostylis stenocarpa TaxID=92480 RepID=A0AA86VH49_9FABA|nr:unnamed protein product [Sphenostylis stenocarpa]